MKVKLRKLGNTADASKMSHIAIDYTIIGETDDEPTVGYVMELRHCDNDSGYFHTSEIKQIIDDHTFRTRNSFYHWERVEEKNASHDGLIPTDENLKEKAFDYLAKKHCVERHIVEELYNMGYSDAKNDVDMFVEVYKIALEDQSLLGK